jgi:hypothetical protein
MKVKLTADTAVRFDKGTVLEVSDREATRLLAFRLAEEVKAKKAETKPAKKK